MTRASADPLTKAAQMAARMLGGTELFGRIRDQDVTIATSPKELVWQQDKVSLYRFRPLVEQRVRTGPDHLRAGRPLDDDRPAGGPLAGPQPAEPAASTSMSWTGQPNARRPVPDADDYICGYLGDCVGEVARRAQVRRINLLGVCEGGVFTTRYAALQPARVNTMTLTITPIDFHADAVGKRDGHGFINIWTRSLEPADIDRLIDAYGNLPGELIGAVFNMMTPVRTMLKYNFDLLDVMDDEAAAKLAAHGEVDRRPPRSPGRRGEAVDEGAVSAEQACEERVGLDGSRSIWAS